MAQSSLRMAFVMDPVESESFTASTTLVLMLEAQRRGHEVLYVAPSDLGVDSGRAVAWATPILLKREGQGGRVERLESRRVLLDDEVDVVFQRQDPPVDARYIVPTQILGTCARSLVLNRPTSVLAYNEKLLALHFRDLMPESTVSRKISDLVAFMDAMGGEMIVKPLDGKGGEGIFHLVAGERNISSTLEQITAFEGRWVMAQRYLPGIRQGDKRILLMEGEPLGAVLRIPADHEVRANFHAGGRAAAAEIDAGDRVIVDRLAPLLRAEGLFFVGIDVIGGLLTEINVTSPTGVQEINALNGVRLEERLVDRVEALRAEEVRRI
ncbi:MAG TPA: glutathione synthase [Myxococcales bacterium]|nr:glutathione synthase [Myxococcales bacterium]HIL80161.1 glutathione synthase [Myxococcales bacterium]